MILLDWTRMGKSYCLAGVIVQGLDVRVVRPLLVKHRGECVRNVGWPPCLLDGHARWELFELVGAEPAEPEPPHLEDVWVRSLHPRRLTAAPELRRAILAATATPKGHDPFGAPLVTTRSAAYLQPGTGDRSLATVLVPSSRITFGGSWRDGVAEPDVRVKLPLPDLQERLLPVKDHHLLARVQQVTADLQGQFELLDAAVRQMGETVAVRLGLSRPFQAEDGRGGSFCWLMADGFFSLADPQS
jgi:hypothetical protein